MAVKPEPLTKRREQNYCPWNEIYMLNGTTKEVRDPTWNQDGTDIRIHITVSGQLEDTCQLKV